MTIAGGRSSFDTMLSLHVNSRPSAGNWSSLRAMVSWPPLMVLRGRSIVAAGYAIACDRSALMCE